jgi:hypothetical protein
MVARVPARGVSSSPLPAPSQEREAGKDPVPGQGLEDPGSAQNATHGTGQGSSPDPHQDGVPPDRHAAHDQRVQQQGPRLGPKVEDQRNGHVDQIPDADGSKGSPGNGPAGVFQISGHVDTGHDARHRRKEDREHDPEPLPLMCGLVRELGGGALGSPPEEEGQEREGNGAHDEVLGPDGHPGGGDGQERHSHRRGQSHGLFVQDGEGTAHALGEAHSVKGHREPLGEEEGDSNGPTRLDSQGPADHVVGPSGPDPLVRGDGGDGQRGEEGDGGCQSDDGEGAPKPHVPHHPPEPEVHDDPQDGKDGRGKDPAEGAKASRFTGSYLATTRSWGGGAREFQGAKVTRVGSPIPILLLGEG